MTTTKASFLDLDPRPDSVTISGKKLPVPGIDLIGMAYLAKHHPELSALFDGGDLVERLATMDRKLVDAFVAAGMGYAGDEQAEKIAHGFGVQEQLDVIDAIIGRSMPDGIGPFVDTFVRLIKRLMRGPPPQVEAAIRKMQAKSSVSSLPNSSHSAIPKVASGA